MNDPPSKKCLQKLKKHTKAFGLAISLSIFITAEKHRDSEGVNPTELQALLCPLLPTLRPRIWLMAALSFNVHSATTFALISFIYNINALRGFFMCGFFFSSSFLESWCFLKSKDTTDRDLTVRTPCKFIKLIPSNLSSINPQQSLERGPEGSLEPSPWLLWEQS